jgi:hypothetical protein
VDLTVSPKWEINFGVGIGPTAATDHWIVKGIIGRRFDWGKPKTPNHLCFAVLSNVFALCHPIRKSKVESAPSAK